MKKILLSVVAMFLGYLGPSAQAEADLLPPEEAFRLSAQPTASGVRLQWDIADGYYLYRTKFRFVSDDSRAEPGEPSYPPGKVKEDEFFGAMETYRGRLVLDLPVQRTQAVPDWNLKVTSQGCADIGICYPPHTTPVVLSLLAPAAAATPAARTEPAAPRPLEALKQLGASLGLVEDEFLHPDQAFRLTALPGPEGGVLAIWEVEPGYYLYRDKFRFRVIQPGGGVVETVALPRGVPKDDPTFGSVEVMYERVEIPLSVPAANPGETVELEIGYQGCAEAGICYPPVVKSVSLVLGEAGGTWRGRVDAVAAGGAAGRDAEPVSEQDRLAARLASDSVLITALWFFGFGLLLAFTPCVFPMIPILSGIIAGQGSHITTRKAFILSLTYVLAMSVTYTLAGVIAGMFGANLQAALQNPWMLSAFAVIFVLLALSMFGFYDLQLPSSWQAKLADLSNRQRGGTLAGVAIMGFLSALIVGPCVAPPLAGALIYIGQTGDPWLGGMALFALSMGMGAPLVAVGTLEGKYLPRAGGWMNAVKAVFGVAMLGVAIFLLDRVLPGTLILLLWAMLLIISGIYLGALEPLGKDAGGFRKLWKGLGVVLVVYGALLMIGSAAGTNDVFQPLKGLGGGPAGTASQEKLPFKPIKTLADLEREVQSAAAGGQPVMLDFYADWCIACKELERFTFSDADVQRTLSTAVLLKADVTANDADDQALLKAFGLFGPPAVLFFGSDGQERRGYRLVGFVGAKPFQAHAEKALQ